MALGGVPGNGGSGAMMNDLFGNGPDQPGLDFGDAPAARSYAPAQEDVRAELLSLLAQAKAARDHSPWDKRTFRYHQVVFPQMANWLAPEERDQLCFEFASELKRIELMIAA